MESALRAHRQSENIKQWELARSLKIGAPTLCKWERGRIPAERVLDVERVTGIPRHMLRPDLYPLDRSDLLEVQEAAS